MSEAEPLRYSDLLEYRVVDGKHYVSLNSLLDTLAHLIALPDALPIGIATLTVLGDVLVETAFVADQDRHAPGGCRQAP